MNDWQAMLETDILTLGMAADDTRRAARGSQVVTYRRVLVLPDAAAVAAASVPGPADEVRLHALPATLAEAVAAVRALSAAAGGRRVAAFSMAALERQSWGALDRTLQALVEAGLHDVAELPADELDDLAASIAALQRAGVSPQRITVTQAVADRRALLMRVVAACGAADAPRRFAPLPRVAPLDTPTTGYDDVRMVALARLALGERSIEVDWSLYGPKLAQVALTFGADHLDAVSPLDEPALGPRRGVVEDVERNIRAAGFEPAHDGPRS